MAIARVNSGGGHSYTIDGTKVPGVTTIIGDALPKPALINWAGNVTAAYAVDHWPELGELPPSQRLERLKKAKYEDRDQAARRGTEVHALAEALARGEEVDVPEELAGHVEAYVDFLNSWEPVVVLSETVVANRAIGYCGTLDLIADMRHQRWLLELKTTRSGIFPESALQACAYGRAEVWLDAFGDEHPMDALGINRAAAVHIRADGWDLRPLDVGEEVWAVFRHLAWLRRHLEDNRRWVNAALVAS